MRKGIILPRPVKRDSCYGLVRLDLNTSGLHVMPSTKKSTHIFEFNIFNLTKTPWGVNFFLDLQGSKNSGKYGPSPALEKGDQNPDGDSNLLDE